MLVLTALLGGLSAYSMLHRETWQGAAFRRVYTRLLECSFSMNQVDKINVPCVFWPKTIWPTDI